MPDEVGDRAILHREVFVKKQATVVLLAAALSVCTVFEAGAIRYGQRDGDAHPYVGLLYSFVSDEVGGYICSGTLISPTVFLTAAHCVVDPEITEFLVSFEERPLETGFNWVSGTAFPHPMYDGLTLPNTYDIAVVVLDQPVELEEYGALPEAGFLDTLATARGTKDVSFTAVGYGLQDSQNPNARRQVLDWDIARYQGRQQLVGLQSAIAGGYNLVLTNNPGQGTGGSGTCSGDSGGPILWDNTNVVVAINSFGIAPFCRGTDYAFRTDTEVAREFLAQFVTLP
jgi:secreted trypsin-like serine protease